MAIITVGLRAFRITELVNGDAYANDELLEGDVDFLDDREHNTDPRTQQELMQLFEVCHTLIFQDYPRNIEGQAAEYPSFVVASALPLHPISRHQILDLPPQADPPQRL